MSKKASDAVLLTVRKQQSVIAAVQDRPSASSTSLARSYDLPVPDIQRILRNCGVQDDG